MAYDSFDVVNKAKDLMKHTYKMTGNKDRYPSKYIILIQDMQKICMQIRHCIRFANKTPLKNNSEERLKMQSDAITLCDELSDDVEMSKEFNLIGSDVTISYEVVYYNGGYAFDDAIEEALDKMNRRSSK